jgi:hypothetical protein
MNGLFFFVVTTTKGDQVQKALKHLPMFVTGIVLAFSVALIFRLVPDDFPTKLSGRIVLFAVALVTAPVFVLVIRWWEKVIKRPHSLNATIATVGALTFDSTAHGFAPQLYCFSGSASTSVFASIVFGGISIILFDYLTTDWKSS